MNNFSQPSTHQFVDELRPSIEPVIVGIWGIIILGAWFLGAHPIVIASFSLPVLIYFLYQWNPNIGRWISVIGLTLFIGWLHQVIPGALVLWFISTALAAALIGVKAAVITAICQSFLAGLMVFFQLGVVPTDFVLSLIGIWTILGLFVIVYQPFFSFVKWAQDYYQITTSQLSEALNQKVELQQALSDLANASRNLKAANSRVITSLQLAEEAQTAKAAFVAKVSHEFRTPLNMIIGLVDLLVHSPELFGNAIPSEIREDLQIIYRNSQHLTSLVNDVLDLSQSESGRMVLYKELTSLQSVVNEAFTVVRPLIEKKKLLFSQEIPDDLPPIYCDRTRVRQIVLNLLSNAARFVDSGSITIQAVQRDDYIVVSVADTGPGITREDSKRIFEPFCQGTDRLWNDKGGSGLGLTICRQLVEQHGGKIWLESELGIGTVFYFDLPIYPPVTPFSDPNRWILNDWEWKENPERKKLPDLIPNPLIVTCDETGLLSNHFAHTIDGVEIVNLTGSSLSEKDLPRPADMVVLSSHSVEEIWPMMDQIRTCFSKTPVLGCVIPAKFHHPGDHRVIKYLMKPLNYQKIKTTLETIDFPVHSVLIVDDAPEASMLLRRLLLSVNQGLNILIADCGKDALQKLQTTQVDLIFLDVVLSDMDGWELLKMKDTIPEIQQIPVIFATGQDPLEQPSRSQVLLFTLENGIGIDQFVNSSMKFANLLSQP